jgi:hypothetical protein
MSYDNQIGQCILDDIPYHSSDSSRHSRLAGSCGFEARWIVQRKKLVFEVLGDQAGTNEVIRGSEQCTVHSVIALYPIGAHNAAPEWN